MRTVISFEIAKQLTETIDTSSLVSNILVFIDIDWNICYQKTEDLLWDGYLLSSYKAFWVDELIWLIWPYMANVSLIYPNAWKILMKTINKDYEWECLADCLWLYAIDLWEDLVL